MIALQAIMPMIQGGYAVFELKRMDAEFGDDEAGSLWWVCKGRFNRLSLNYIKDELPNAYFLDIKVSNVISGVRFQEEHLL